MNTKRVIDTSPWNIITNWNAADAWIFCASWTQNLEADHFGEYWIACPKPRGAFFAQYFDRYRTSGQQARLFADILKKRGGVRPGDRLFSDAEVGTISIKGILDFLYNLKLALGDPPGVRYGIYSRKDLLDVPLNMNTEQLANLKKLDLWVAGHPNKIEHVFPPPTGYIPDQSKYGPPVLFQYGTDLLPADYGIAGVTSSIDLNSVDDAYWEEWSNAPLPPVEPPTEPPTGETGMYTATVKVAKLNVRAEPSASAEDIGDIGQNVVVTGDELKTLPSGDQWLRISWSVNGVPRVGWIATRYGGAEYCTVTGGPETPPPTASSIQGSMSLTLPDGSVYEGQVTLPKKA